MISGRAANAAPDRSLVTGRHRCHFRRYAGRMSSWRLGAVLLAFAMCSCIEPSNSTPRGGHARPPPPAGRSQAANSSAYAGRYCQDAARRAQACGQTPDPPDRCQHGVRCSAAVMRPDAHPLVLSCIANRACMRPDEACFIEVSRQVRSSPEAQRFTSACISAGANCGGVHDDLCHAGRSGAFTDAFYATVGACFSQPCGAMERCFDDAFRRAMPPGCSPKTMW